jgi:hypothetical protein
MGKINQEEISFLIEEFERINLDSPEHYWRTTSSL